jgi:hypothetical protein
VLKNLPVWLLVAVVVTWPAVLGQELIGDPAADVWNHAWGYWYVAESLGRGAWPFFTELAGGPDGGTLWFIDAPGAIVMTPVTWLLGPAVAYNLVLMGRLALTGWATQGLARELGSPGWLAGVAAMTSPFLLCELGNGISEVCAAQWLAMSLWAAARAKGWAGWALTGLLMGICGVVTFYYGLASAALVAVVALWRRDPKALAAIGVQALLFLPIWFVFKASLAAEDALILRGTDLDVALLRHNAVDPRVFVMPGGFQSIDLQARFGEALVHTGYLRWTLLLLAGWATWANRKLWGWWLVILASVAMGMGHYLFWDEQFVEAGGRLLALPFGWLKAVLPEVAITHPLRFALGANLVLAAVAACAPLGRMRGPAIALVAAEGIFASAANWPLPMSPTDVPSFYEDVGEGMVLDLPMEAGATMKTSQYFWFQTVHERPIPWTPDVRRGSVRDPDVFWAAGSNTLGENPVTPPAGALDHYALIVIHPEMEPDVAARWKDALGKRYVFTEEEGHQVARPRPR